MDLLLPVWSTGRERHAFAEALNLQPHDANWSESLLTISGAKFKSRLVPLHPSTKEVLLAYAKRRDQIYASRRLPYFFVSSPAHAESADQVRWFY
jgi:integrase/recombinase XerD